MKKRFLFLIFAMFVAFAGTLDASEYSEYVVRNDTSISIRVRAYYKKGDWRYDLYIIKPNEQASFGDRYLGRDFNHADINIDGKTIAQPDKSFFKKNASKTISVTKKISVTYNVKSVK